MYLVSLMKINKEHFPGTPTAGHQFDFPRADVPDLVGGLAANCDLVRLVEDCLARHHADFTRLVVADIGLDAHHPWLWLQRLPCCCDVVATPKAGQHRNHVSCINKQML